MKHKDMRVPFGFISLGTAAFSSFIGGRSGLTSEQRIIDGFNVDVYEDRDGMIVAMCVWHDDSAQNQYLLHVDSL